MVSQCCFDLHFSNDQWWWAFFHMFVASYMSSFEKCLFISFSHFWMDLFVFLVNSFLLFVDSVYKPFVRWVDCKNFFPFCWLLVCSNDCFFSYGEALEFNWVPFVYFGFCCQCFWCFSHEVLAYAYVLDGFPRYSSRVFMVFGLMFEFLIHLELILV